MKKLIVLSALCLCSCATQKFLTPTGGSRSDGTVVLSYQYGLFEKPVVQMSNAESQAAARCNAWGYKGAQAFGGQQQQCLARNGYGNCVSVQVNVTYQCTGSPK